jgi:hypothetical protein
VPFRNPLKILCSFCFQIIDKVILSFKNLNISWERRLMPVILDSVEAELGRIVVCSQQSRVLESPSEPMTECGGVCLSSPAPQEVQIGELQSRPSQS